VSTCRIMTYNMLHAPGDRLQALTGVVTAINPDILACQEINTFDGMMALARELNMMPVWGPANAAEDHRNHQPLYEHLVLFTRIPTSASRRPRGDVSPGVGSPGGYSELAISHPASRAL